ncbi:hypothetical protein BJY00DRAFT_323709 [Aspergillus carlsbadensis]|nr:hypothetical protein BJY00DRAFT_323709 [Aspergillus carlsbadensis]
MGLFGSIISSAADMFRNADDQSVRNLIETVFERIKRSPDLIRPTLLLETAKSLTYSVLGGVFGAVGSVSSIQEAVLRNEMNATTLILIRDRAGELARFVLDCVEAAKCYYLANGRQRGQDDEHVLYSEFNELDFSVFKNQHAAICQIQRLALSIVYILQHLFKPVALGDIDMSGQTKLQSDRGIGLRETYSTGRGAQSNGEPDDTKDLDKKKLNPTARAHVDHNEEKWLFVNGIGGELFWLQLACDKLRAMFYREVTGVFNRGDGLLWDLVECAGQRSSYVPDPGPDSATLRTDVDGVNSHTIMIAHSQGCLLLRRVLEDLIESATTDPGLSHKMQTRLCVFTFASPSLHWKTQKSHPNPPHNLDGTYLSSHVLRTEHFANRRDFVAQLGVLSKDSDYGRDEVFINEDEDWIGHFFGTQYSLEPNLYENSNHHRSWLLGCRFGTKMSTFGGS